MDRQRKLCWRSIKNALRLRSFKLQGMGQNVDGDRLHMIKGKYGQRWVPGNGERLTTETVLHAIKRVEFWDEQKR